MKLLFLLFTSTFSIFPSLAVDVTCPNGVITSNTPVGAFPAAGSAQFPANYACMIQFQIPDGQIVKFGIQNNLLFDSLDTFTIQDATSTLYSMYIVNNVFYVPATTAKINITTQTNTASMYFTWQYVDVSNYVKIQKPTGSIVSMNLTANSYYQFVSTKSQVAFHTGSISGTPDLGLARIYVYDGEDLNAKFIGNLQVFTDYGIPVSSGKSLVLVNFFGTAIQSYGIANDNSAIAGYDGYSFIVARSDMNTFTHATSNTGKEYAMTYYSYDSQENYVWDIKFLNPNVTGQEIRVKPMGPMNGYGNLLTYNVRDAPLGSVPQQVLSNTFTVLAYQCDAYITIISRPSIDWGVAKPGRSGSMISSSIWNPTIPITAPYFNTFNSTSPVKFVFDIQSIVVANIGEKLRIEVGSPGSTPVIVEHDKTATNTGTKIAHGTYMSTIFSGATSASSFNMKFSIEENVETTTKSSNTMFSFVTLAFIFVNLLR